MGISATNFSAPVEVDDVTLQKSEAGVISIKDDGVNTTQIINDAVTDDKISSIFGLKKIASTTLTVAGTTFTFSSLTAYTKYLIVLEGKNATANNGQVSVFVNGDTTATNYYCQYITGNGTTIAGARTNAAWISLLSASVDKVFFVNIAKSHPDGTAGILSADCINAAASGSALYSVYLSMQKTATITTISSLSLVSTDNLTIGSTATLYAYI